MLLFKTHFHKSIGFLNKMDQQKELVEKETCSIKFRNVMGFNPIDKPANLVLDMQRSLFTPVCGRRVMFFMVAMYVIAFATHTGAMFTSLTEFNAFCEERSPTDPEAPGPSCKLDWITYGPNQVSLCVFLWLLVSLLSSFFYANVSTYERIPLVLMVQWGLGVTSIIFTYLSFCVQFIEWRGDTHPRYIQVDQKINISLAVIFSVLGLYEIRVRHLLYAQFIYFCHVLTVLFVDMGTGIFADQPLLDLVSLDFFMGIMALGGVLSLVVVILAFVHKIKLWLFCNGSLMKQSVIATILPGSESEAAGATDA
jgi:hypothetical protein